ncbi:MAG: ABC transporter permease [Vicinamibacteria bacterium]|jgi:sodium transport system permease protein|nr:ABC transporter permease [Vicinamibacteria bacterium]MBP9944932.1 ABC transporter permease [Vicinamibacteria bacterium]
MWNQTFAILRKESREIWRDRRSLGSGLFYGIWGPLVMALALTALARDRGSDAPLDLAVSGANQAPSLMAFLSERQVANVQAPSDSIAEVRARRLPVALVISNDYGADFRRARPATVTLVYDGSWTQSRSKAERVKSLLGEYARRVNDTRLILRGVSPTAITALEVAERDLATPAGRAATVLALLPIFVLLAAFIGGMSVAADLTAGERERGSLESLLLNPASRLTIVLGKWAAASVVGLATVALTIGVSHAMLRHPRVQAIDLPVGLSGADALQMALVLAPLTLFASALQILIGLLAKTYKEAQTQLSLLTFLPMLPGFLFAFGSLQPAEWMLWVPMVGQHVAMSDIVRGEILSGGRSMAMAASSLLGTAAFVAMATGLLGRESTLRRFGG